MKKSKKHIVLKVLGYFVATAAICCFIITLSSSHKRKQEFIDVLRKDDSWVFKRVVGGNCDISKVTPRERIFLSDWVNKSNDYMPNHEKWNLVLEIHHEANGLALNVYEYKGIYIMRGLKGRKMKRVLFTCSGEKWKNTIRKYNGVKK